MSAAGSVHPFKLASILLQYPTRALFEGLDALDAANAAQPSRIQKKLSRFLAWLRETEPVEVAARYVETFDLKRRSVLYLTYYRYGDTRERGMALLDFKRAYREAGLSPTDDDLPDYLPMVLDFAAAFPRGVGLLVEHRCELEILSRGLREANSPYADIIDGISANLPALKRGDLAVVRKLWEGGPPSEEVGVEPFAPPRYLQSPNLVQLKVRR